MKVREFDIVGVFILTPKRFEDERGYFCETYNQRICREHGIDYDFIQDNHSMSTKEGTVRGLHYQAAPHAQTKLVRAVRGAIIDVVVDARVKSATFGQWIKAELSAENGCQMLVPRGCLHGFATLTPNVEVSYKVDAHYDKDADGSIRWDDPELGIDWGLGSRTPVLSTKDAEAQSWRSFREIAKISTI
ncbi:MAG: dTDP-4-dehydrorhamnose 3,5-epimerase [Pseudomonadota bacterium]